jgi:hypothetical protein
VRKNYPSVEACAEVYFYKTEAKLVREKRMKDHAAHEQYMQQHPPSEAPTAQQQAAQNQMLMNIINNPQMVVPGPAKTTNCVTRTGPYGSFTTECN